MYSPVPNNRKNLNRRKGGGGPIDNLNIKKRGVQIKQEVSEKCSRSKVATRYH